MITDTAISDMDAAAALTAALTEPGRLPVRVVQHAVPSYWHTHTEVIELHQPSELMLEMIKLLARLLHGHQEGDLLAVALHHAIVIASRGLVQRVRVGLCWALVTAEQLE